MMIPAGTPEWYAARVGMITASRMGDLSAKTKSGYGATHDRYIAQLVQERLTHQPYPSFTSKAMQWGIDHEDEAAELYAWTRNVEVQAAGFVPHPTIPRCGASPDRRVGDDGLIEIKCPETHTHIQYLLNRSVPREYLLQMQWQMECDNRAWCDWISYDPRFEGGDIPPGSEMLVIRVQRDETIIRDLCSEVRRGDAEVQRLIERLMNRQQEAA